MNPELIRYIKDTEGKQEGSVLVTTDVDDYVISVSRVYNFFALPMLNLEQHYRGNEEIIKIMFPAKLGHYMDKKQLFSWGDILELFDDDEDEGGMPPV